MDSPPLSGLIYGYEVMRTLPAGQGPGWWRWCYESSVPSILYPGKEAESIVQGTWESIST